MSTARYRKYLKERYKTLMGYTAGIMAIIGGFMLSPLIMVPFYPDELKHIWSFLLGSLPFMAGGIWLKRRLVQDEQDTGLTVSEGMVIVTLSWLMAITIGTIPFLFVSGLNVTDAFFESTSGWTATGLTVVDVDNSPHIILFYRSMIQLAGAAGFAIIMLSAVTGPQGPGLTIAEGRTDQLVPHVRRSASIVLSMYLSYIFVGILALWAAGMTLFEAINHSFTAVATGGFSTSSLSIAYWDSPLIEAIIIVLMILGAINFLTAYTLIRGKFKAFIHNGEIRMMAVLMVVSVTAVLIAVTSGVYSSFGKSVRVAVFEVTSAFTTAGFNTVYYDSWAESGWIILMGLMIIGGGSGSTAGGIKLHRVYALYKGLKFQFRRAFLPAHAITDPDTYQGETRHFYSESEMNLFGLFAFLYIIVIFVGSTITAMHGFSMKESMFEFASVLANVGLSVGVTSEASDSLLWFQIVGMLFGRLEFFTVVIGLVKLGQDVGVLAIDPETRRKRQQKRAERRAAQEKAAEEKAAEETEIKTEAAVLKAQTRSAVQDVVAGDTEAPLKNEDDSLLNADDKEDTL